MFYNLIISIIISIIALIIISNKKKGAVKGL